MNFSTISGPLIIIGIVLTLLGITALLACIYMAYQVKKADLPDNEAKARLQKVVAWNLGALLLSGLGLGAVAVGVILG